MVNTKHELFQYISDLSRQFDPQNIALFSTRAAHEKLNISRSLASQYLNELVLEGKLIKVGQRPVYFFNHLILINEHGFDRKIIDALDIDDLLGANQHQQQDNFEFSQLVGVNGSLKTLIDKIKMSVNYPDHGLPIIIYGENGTGKSDLVNRMIRYDFNKYQKRQKYFKLDCAIETVVELDLSTISNEVIVIENAQLMTLEFQEQLIKLFEKNQLEPFQTQHKRVVLVSTNHPEEYLLQNLMNYFPLIGFVPSLEERSLEEKQNLIVSLFKEEINNIKRGMVIDSSTLRALFSYIYEDNIIGIRNATKYMSAKAMSEKSYKDNYVYLMPTHLPEEILHQLKPVFQENELIDLSKYEVTKDIELVLDLFDSVLASFKDKKETMTDLSLSNIEELSDQLLFNRGIRSETIDVIDNQVRLAIEEVLKYKNINFPVSSSLFIAKVIYLCQQYKESFEKWKKQHQSTINEILNYLEQNDSYEYSLSEKIVKSVGLTFGYPYEDIVTVIISIILIHYSKTTKNRKVFGLIICHGYSTASSMANAVNTLLNDYVFEAIDMPLEVNVDDIVTKARLHINRMSSLCDVVVMVDMGSLEDIGRKLQMPNRTIGVINNVSTKLALDVGYRILRENNIESIIKQGFDNFYVNHKVIYKTKKKDVILVISENGISMAHRIKEMFKDSIDFETQIEILEYDYGALLADGIENPIFKNYNIIFITGTANPEIPEVPFFSLEGLITSTNLESLQTILSPYINPVNLDEMIENLRMNFTLKNVMKHLTILNPSNLLENVSKSIDLLQNHLGRKFNGATLIGLYIHTSCLVERLVTKSAVQEHEGLAEFANEQRDFVNVVHNSFGFIKENYNVDIPMSEIEYLFEYINQDQNRERAHNSDWSDF